MNNKNQYIREHGEGYLIKLESYNCDFLQSDRQQTLDKAMRSFISKVNEKFGVVYLLWLDDIKHKGDKHEKE